MVLIILTGDFVGSTTWERNDLPAAFDALASARDRLALWPETSAMLARRGGDGWQLATTTPSSALRVTLHMAAHLAATDPRFRTRIAVAEGAGTLPEAADLNAQTDGPYVQSGRALDAIGRSDALWTHAAGGAQAASFILAAACAEKWTQPQAEAVSEMIAPNAGPRRAAAARLNKSRQAVDQALHAARYPELLQAITAMEQQDAN